MNLFSSVDTMFATFFAILTVTSVIALVGYTATLSKKDLRTVNNSIFSSAVLSLFFVAMMIPTVGFCYHGMFATAGMCMVMAGVVCTCLSYTSKRAADILNIHFGV